ncbi:hypothetical protein GGI04_003624 [Coemansia thaxteri]|nr:hypothetical protein GGI04_003624 [Coemansia thaxteri]KAJ2467043.1 hypothetical protein GGI02_004167 [Coemansia sp. RSA 2322]
MRLAERNTVDIQQALLERKRHSGGHSVEDDLDEREAREKRRKLELEKRIKQREDEERARLAGAERRRRERLDAKEADDLRRKQTAQQQRATARTSAGPSTSTSTSANTKGARNGTAARVGLTKTEPVPRRPAAQPLSYDALMRIASGREEAPAKPQALQRREPGAVPPKVKADVGLVRRQHPTNGSGPAKAAASNRVRSPNVGLPLKSREPTPLAPARKEAAIGRSAEHQPRLKAPPAPRLRELPEPRVRQAPEREIDRFGVCAGQARRTTANRTAPKGATLPSTRAEPLPRSRGRRDEQESRPPAPRSSGPRDLRAGHGDRGEATQTRGGMTADNGRRLRTDSPPRRRLPPPPHPARNARRANGDRQASGRRRQDRYDDDSEYDSLDDFVVDDEEEDGPKIRAGYIRKMLGVRYHHVANDDDDDDDMEVSASQLMMEDRRSAKIGRLEDEEEERRLAEEEEEEEERARARRRRLARERRG